jgi:hypothetical protein
VRGGRTPRNAGQSDTRFTVKNLEIYTHRRLRNVKNKLSSDDIDAISGYLESVKNLACCADVLIQHRVYDLLYTILEEMAVNCQHIIDEFCTVEE